MFICGDANITCTFFLDVIDTRIGPQIRHEWISSFKCQIIVLLLIWIPAYEMCFNFSKRFES
jgi:hypothetical protein